MVWLRGGRNTRIKVRHLTKPDQPTGWFQCGPDGGGAPTTLPVCVGSVCRAGADLQLVRFRTPPVLKTGVQWRPNHETELTFAESGRCESHFPLVSETRVRAPAPIVGGSIEDPPTIEGPASHTVACFLGINRRQ